MRDRKPLKEINIQSKKERQQEKRKNQDRDEDIKDLENQDTQAKRRRVCEIMNQNSMTLEGKGVGPSKINEGPVVELSRCGKPLDNSLTERDYTTLLPFFIIFK